MLLPLYLWLASDRRWTWLSDVRLVAPWTALVAFLVISSVATYSWGSLRLRRNVRLEAILVIAIAGAALFAAPFGDAERRRDRLSGADSRQHPQLRQGQAAARRACRGATARGAAGILAGGTPRKAATIAAQCAFRVNSRTRASATSKPRKNAIESQ